VTQPMTSVPRFCKSVVAQPIQMSLKDPSLHPYFSRHDANIAMPRGLCEEHVEQDPKGINAQVGVCARRDLRAQTLLLEFKRTNPLLELLKVVQRALVSFFRRLRMLIRCAGIGNLFRQVWKRPHRMPQLILFPDNSGKRSH